jgi:hypothetical protein
MPIAWSWETTRSARAKNGGSGVIQSTANPLGWPASFMSWRAFSTLNSSSGHLRPYSTSSLIQLPLTLPSPADSVSLIAARSTARLMAWRTRLSWNGLFGSWKPTNSSQKLPDSTGASISLGFYFTRSISSPGTP